MKILSESEVSSRFDFVRPMEREPQKPDTAWPIPFEYGDCPKGTRISVAMAKTIAAELRAHIAEAEARVLRQAFEAEKSRAKQWEEHLVNANLLSFERLAEIERLKKRLRARRKK